MDYDSWLRLLNTIANYATAILVLVLVNRDTRERRIKRKSGRALREAVDRVRTERPPVQPRASADGDNRVPADLIMGNRCVGNACSEHHTYAEGCQLAHLASDRDRISEIRERRGTFGDRAEALGWGSQGRRPSSLRHPDQDDAGDSGDRSDVGIPDRPSTPDPDDSRLSPDGKFVTE